MATENAETGGSNTDQSGQPSELQRIFEENPIIEVFNKPSNLRVVITLIDAGGMELPVSDIAERANVEPQTFYNNEELLLEYGLIEKGDKIGNTQTYQVDLANDVIQTVMNLYDEMIDAAENME